jgi:hypothetical protein
MNEDSRIPQFDSAIKQLLEARFQIALTGSEEDIEVALQRRSGPLRSGSAVTCCCRRRLHHRSLRTHQGRSHRPNAAGLVRNSFTLGQGIRRSLPRRPETQHLTALRRRSQL